MPVCDRRTRPAKVIGRRWRHSGSWESRNGRPTCARDWNCLTPEPATNERAGDRILAAVILKRDPKTEATPQATHPEGSLLARPSLAWDRPGGSLVACGACAGGFPLDRSAHPRGARPAPVPGLGTGQGLSRTLSIPAAEPDFS